MKPGLSCTPTQPADISGSSVYSSSRSDTRSPTTASGRAVACARPGAPGSQPGMGGGGSCAAQATTNNSVRTYNERSMRRALGAMILVSVAAHADGAFPDAFAMFAPADQANTLRMATNFGLVFSNDGAQTWHYVCEQAVITFATLYAEGPDDA